MNIFFESIHFYKSLRTYFHPVKDDIDRDNQHTLDRKYDIKLNEIISFNNGFYPMSLSKHIETLFEQLAHHCDSYDTYRITKDEFLYVYRKYDDSSYIFYTLSNGAEQLTLHMFTDKILELSFLQLQDLMSCVFMTLSIDLSNCDNDYGSGCTNCDTPVLLHSDISDHSTKHSFVSCKDVDTNELNLTPYEDTLMYSNCQYLSPLSVTKSFNIDANLQQPLQTFPTLDITSYTSFVPTTTTTTIDLSNHTSDISNNSIVTINLPDPEMYLLDISMSITSTNTYKTQKHKKSIGEWLCKCSPLSFCMQKY